LESQGKMQGDGIEGGIGNDQAFRGVFGTGGRGAVAPGRHGSAN